MFAALVWIPLILVAVMVYLFAVRSRRTFTCPKCGEEIRTEYLEATRCNTCGAPLDHTGF